MARVAGCTSKTESAGAVTFEGRTNGKSGSGPFNLIWIYSSECACAVGSFIPGEQLSRIGVFKNFADKGCRRVKIYVGI